MKWIHGKFRPDDFRYNDESVQCSACGYIQDMESSFCPCCGERNTGKDTPPIYGILVD